MIEIEFYQQNGLFFACIGGDNASNYDISGTTVEEVAEQVRDYIVSYVEFDED